MSSYEVWSIIRDDVFSKEKKLLIVGRCLDALCKHLKSPKSSHFVTFKYRPSYEDAAQMMSRPKSIFLHKWIPTIC